MRVKDIVNKAGKGPPDRIIPWMTNDLRTSLKNKGKTNEEFKKRSERNRKNKTKG